MPAKSKPTPAPPTPPKKIGRPAKATEDLVAIAETFLARRFTKGRIKDMIRAAVEQRGDTISPRTCETILARARANMLERSGKPRESHRDEAYDFYTSMLQEKGASAVARIKAQERIDKLLGLEAPTRLEVAGKNGGPMQIDLTKLADEDLAALERIATAAAGAAQPGGHPGGAGPPKPP